ncbi:hypothetical protein TNIN_158511 [Trichonephila inaurata madagascariensis]|uniref:Uncharacterized protein n=1 Tax=Trichonephila inaurata madagascariensis TaxID=2747483 RepID=A0A8X6XZC0_9ARAC|nr:hypothetical protein TNIN_158511 [Trichonephila inaurata madagascariensis]
MCLSIGDPVDPGTLFSSGLTDQRFFIFCKSTSVPPGRQGHLSLQLVDHYLELLFSAWIDLISRFFILTLQSTSEFLLEEQGHLSLQLVDHYLELLFYAWIDRSAVSLS